MFRPQDGVMVETSTNWALFDPIIPLGVFAVGSDDSAVKVGNGIDVWSDLSYLGSSAIQGKSVQSSRDPANNEILVFCDAENKWVYRLQGCADTVTAWESSSTVFPTFTLLVEIDDSTTIPTGRFKIADGATSFPTLPWYGGNIDTGGLLYGESIEWNGSVFNGTTYLKPSELQSAEFPTGKFHRDDGTWATISDSYVEGPTVAINGNIPVFNGITGHILSDSGVNLSEIPATDGCTGDTWQINNGVKLVDVSGELHVKDDSDAYSNIRCESLYSTTATFDSIVLGGVPTEPTSISLTADGTYVYVDGGKLISVNNDGHGCGFDADTLDSYHANQFATLEYISGTFPTASLTTVVDNFVSFATTDGLQLSDSGYNAASFATILHTQFASTVILDHEIGSTYTTLQHWVNAIQSSGRVSGGVITAHSPADGTIDISALTGFIKLTDSAIGEVEFFDLPASTSISLTDDTTNYIYVEYNSGTPRIQVTTDRSTIRYTDQFNLGRAFRKGTDVEVLTSGINLYNRSRLTHEKWIDTFGGVSYASGLTTSCTGLKPAITAGVLYAGSNKITVDAIDCNVSDTFTYFYTSDSGSTWTEVATNTLNNTQYNDITTGLATLDNNQYGIHWIYVCSEGDMYVLYGKDTYTLTEAQAVSGPTSPIPNYLAQWAKLAAKVIIAKSATSVYSITSAWSTAFPVQNPGAHNDLAGLQGGTTDQYYHLTATQFASTPMYWGELSTTPATYKSSDMYWNTGDSSLKIFIGSGVGWKTITTT